MFITRSCILLAVLAFAATQNGVTKMCNITEKLQGECIAIALCPRAIHMIRINRYDLLKNITCGFDKLDAKVCCDIKKIDDIIFKNSTEEADSHSPDRQANPTNTPLQPDQARTGRPTTRPSTSASIPTTRLTYTTPYPLTTKPSPEDVMQGSHHGGTGAAPIEYNPNPQIDYENGREPDQSKISPPLPSTLAQPELPPSNSNPNSVPPPSLQYPVNILPNRNVCGLMDTSDRIYGGKLAGIDELPWLVRIKYRMPDFAETYACHGSLITDRFVLTAAHCVSNKEIIEVRLGDWDAETVIDCVKEDCNDPPVDVKIEKKYVHPNYNKSTLLGDIALLRLATPLNFTDFIQPICLPFTDIVARQDYDLDQEYLTGGWGKTEFEDISIVKRKVKLSPVAMNTCRVAIKRISDEVAASTICAGGRPGEDSCSGDSGSSLVKQARENGQTNWFIYGITSFGVPECGVEGYPGIYTRVTYYMDWILGVLASSPK